MVDPFVCAYARCDDRLSIGAGAPELRVIISYAASPCALGLVSRWCAAVGLLQGPFGQIQLLRRLHLCQLRITGSNFFGQPRENRVYIRHAITAGGLVKLEFLDV